MKKKTVGSDLAFSETKWHENAEGVQIGEPNTGITKREYFAAMAMQGILATTPHDYSDGRYTVNGGYLHHESVAVVAVECADALIEALNK